MRESSHYAIDAVAYMRPHGLVGHLHQIKIRFTGHRQCFGQRPDPDLRTVGGDEANLTRSDPVVDPGFVVGGGRCYRHSLLVNAHLLLVALG